MHEKLVTFCFSQGAPNELYYSLDNKNQTIPELLSGEGDDKKIENKRMLIALYLKISHVKKIVQVSEDCGLKGYTLLRLGIKHLSKSMQFDQ